MTRPEDDRLPTGRVVVLGATHGGLSVVRSLGRRGLDVTLLTYNPGEHAVHSKYASTVEICPHPTEDEDDFVAFLVDRAEGWRGALLIETNDHYATVLSRHKETLKQHYRLVVPDWEVARIFIEKDRTYALAEQCGVAYPGYHAPTGLDDLEATIDDITFPVMIKPVRSHEFVAAFRTKSFIVDDAASLRREFGRCVEAGLPVVLAEIIPGTDYKTLERVTLYVDTTGDVTVEFYTTKLRQTPPMFGMNKVSKTMPVYEEVREQTLRLLEGCDFRGNAGVEFKRDPRDGQLKLIEINVRILADTQLAIAAGVDLPWIIYQDLVEGRQLRGTEYDDRYYIHLLTDVFELFSKERDRLRNRKRIVEPYLARRKAFAYFSLDDPRPFIHEARTRLGRYVGKRST